MDEAFEGGDHYYDGYTRPQQYHYNNNYENHQQYQQQPRYRRPVGTTPSYTNLYHDDNLQQSPRYSSYLTGQNFGILVAIFVIYLFHQRRDGFGRLFRLPDRNWHNVVMDWILELHEYVVAYGRMAVEFVRNVRAAIIADDWLVDDLTMPTARNGALHNNSPRSRMRRNMVAPVAGRMMAVGSRMPELEETDPKKLSLQQAEMTASATAARHANKENTDPVAPAFLRDEDYPVGWLVFDPVLGVVSKREADEYKREQEKKRQREEKEKLKETLELQEQQQQQTASPRRQAPQPKQMQSPQQQYKKSNNNKGKASTPPRPLRTANVMPSASAALHTPPTIAANG